MAFICGINTIIRLKFMHISGNASHALACYLDAPLEIITIYIHTPRVNGLAVYRVHARVP